MGGRTIDLHSELSLRICSRAPTMVKSPKKERDDGLQAICYYGTISWKPVHLKRLFNFKHPILSIKPIRCMGFHYPQPPQPADTQARRVDNAPCL